MATDAFGAAADHASLSGLLAGDPHTQYASHTQGTYAQRPAQPVRLGARFYATDIHVEFVSDGSAWQVSTAASNAIINPTAATGTSEYLANFSPTDANTLPQSYPTGLSRTYFVSSTVGLPVGGSWSLAETLRVGTDVTQTLWNITGTGIWRRYAYSVGNAWLPWSQLHATAGPADSAWHIVGAAGEPAFLNGWLAYVGGYQPRFRKLADGMVSVQGILKSGTMGSSAWTMPVGYRANDASTGFSVVSRTAANVYGFGMIYTTPVGDMVIYRGDNTEMNLNFTYYADA